MYQAVVDTGGMTYKGAQIASSSEVSDLVNSVITGDYSGEETEATIPEELENEIATSTEISEMLSEVFS